MEMSINERIKEIMNSMNYRSVRAFCLDKSLPQSVINDAVRGKSSPSYETLVRLLCACPHISAEWLMRGEGSMLKSNVEVSNTIIRQGSNSTNIHAGGNVSSDASLSKLLEQIEKLQEQNAMLQERVNKLTDKLLG